MKRAADICMLLEGTYPYVRGGVSSWVYELLTGLPELRFSLVFIGGRRAEYPRPRYELPDNVIHLETHYLEEAFKGSEPQRMRAHPKRFAAPRALHDYLKLAAGRQDAPISELGDLLTKVDTLLATVGSSRGLGLRDFLSDPSAWEQIREGHLAGDAQGSFIDYFWTLRLMHAPLFQLAKIAERVPEAGAFHAVSTGYAGFFGALLERRRGRPLILTEHGIYTKERRIDLNQSEWFDKLHSGAEGASPGSGQALRELWIHFFESLGRLTYRSADPIISLYPGNRARQHRDGADPSRTRVIVNGIDTERFAGALAQRTREVPKVVGMVGRVVPIKDVKTFVRTMHQVISALPDAQGWIIGSAEEDQSYGQECEALVQTLGMENKVRFLGHQKVAEIFPKLGLLMLTSISEAQPLAVLEAFAAGVPCVATDVGACRAQIEGDSAADQALGRAGRVVPFADADALAKAAIELLSSREQWLASQAAGLTRVKRYYALRDMLDSYRSVYTQALEAA
jgi:glycosyltransferase involved in cell wall biosynthesis